MFENYGNTYVVNFQIFAPDDSKKSYSTTFVLYSSYEISNLHKHPKDKPIESSVVYSVDKIPYPRRPMHNTLRITTHAEKHLKGDPVINVMKRELRSFFKWGGRDYYAAPKEWKIALTTLDNKMALIMEKGATHYTFMGQRTKKENLLQALSRFIYRSCFEKDPVKLLEYIMKLISLPENVAYVLENRTPYHYFDVEKREKIECRLNTQLISSTEAALEISDGIWASIDINDLDIMVNYYYHNQSRSKRWRLVSPVKLWTMLIGTAPSDSQAKLMMEFLKQNRTQDIVESRAVELMNSLEIKYPNRIKILEKERNTHNYKIMLVRGKIADWVIINHSHRHTDTQKVKVYAFVHESLHEMEQKLIEDNNRRTRSSGGIAMKSLGGFLRGPICIDNMHRNSSLGDQYASRALALLNDNITVTLVYTIDKYLPKWVLEGEKTSKILIDWDAIDSENEDWEKIL